MGPRFGRALRGRGSGSRASARGRSGGQGGVRAAGQGSGRDLRQLHVTVRLVGEQLDLLEQERAGRRVLGQVAGQARAPLGRLAAGDRVRLGALQQRPGGRNQHVALLRREEVVAVINRRLVVHALQPRVAQVYRHVVRRVPHHHCLAAGRLVLHCLQLWRVDAVLLLLLEHLLDVGSERGPNNKLLVSRGGGALWLEAGRVPCPWALKQHSEAVPASRKLAVPNFQGEVAVGGMATGGKEVRRAGRYFGR